MSVDQCIERTGYTLNNSATIFLGDCLKIQGKETQALEKYRRIAKRGKKHFELAAIKMSNILI